MPPMALAANGVNSSRMKTPMLIAATTLAAASAQASDTMRCGQWVVDDETPLQELLAKCGEPTRKEVKTEDIHRKNFGNAGTQRVGTTTTERWYYNRGSQSFPMVVTVVDGKLKSIDKAE